MDLPLDYVPHLDHRITALLAFLIRDEAKFFTQERNPQTGELMDPGRGDLYRGCLEGSGIMLRALLEFVGLASTWDHGTRILSDHPSPQKLKTWKKDPWKADAVLGRDALAKIPAVTAQYVTTNCKPPASSPNETFADFLARLHDDAAKRTAHAAFHKIADGLNPLELKEAVIWLLKEISSRCYASDPITVHGSLCQLMPTAEWNGMTVHLWNGVMFKPAA